MRGWGKVFVGLVCVAVVVGVVDAGAAVGRAPASTKLTIQSWPRGVFGYVSSSNSACANGRRIEVFAASGGRVRRIAVVGAARNQLGYMWLARAQSSERLYAVAVARPGCAAARSRTISPGFQSVPDCGAERVPKCIVVVEFEASNSKDCTDFSAGSDRCGGWTNRGQDGWKVGHGDHDYATFSWSGGSPLSVKYQGFNGDLRTGFFAGTVPCDHCAPFHVEDACNYVSPGPANHYFTPDLPGKQAGEDGGPLYINFEGGDRLFRHTHVTMWGTLYSTFTAQSCVA